jgi:hypothetical protein
LCDSNSGRKRTSLGDSISLWLHFQQPAIADNPTMYVSHAAPGRSTPPNHRLFLSYVNSNISYNPVNKRRHSCHTRRIRQPPLAYSTSATAWDNGKRQQFPYNSISIVVACVARIIYDNFSWYSDNLEASVRHRRSVQVRPCYITKQTTKTATGDSVRTHIGMSQHR